MVQAMVDKTGSGGSVTTVDYAYDDNGLRVSETTGGVTTEYLFDTLNHTGYAKQIEEHVNGTLSRTYTIGHMIHAQHDATNGVLAFLQDGHGSTRALLNTSGSVVQRFAFDAFGETLNGSGLTTADNAHAPWLRPNGAYSGVTGLTYHLDRWRRGHTFLAFDRYNTSDPIALQRNCQKLWMSR